MLVNPALPSAYDVGSGAAKPLMFFGFLKVSGYQGSVLPAFVTGIVGAHFEKWLRHHIPDAIDLIITPFLTLLVSIILALFGIGPLLHAVETFVLWLVENILFLPMGIGGFLYGCFGQLLGIFGIHHILNFLEISMLAKDGWNYLNPIGTCGNVAQAGAVLAVAIKIKNNKTKQVAYPSALSALLGITEPAVFGVNLRLVKPFIAAMIGGGVGGFFASIFHLKATGMSITGIPGTLLYLNSQLPIYILVNVIAFAVAFAITWFFGVKNEEEKEAEAPAPVIENESETLYAIADGEAIVAADIEDPTFADGLLGPCFGIRPTNGNVYAPADGVITLTVPTKHAIGITTSNGAEILLHLGLDTVKMEGKCFQDQLHVGAHVKKGDLLTTMDLDMVKKAGYSTTMITIVTNGQNYDDIHQIKTGEIKAGDEVMALKK